MVSTLENLPDEMLLAAFGYLSAIDLFNALCGLNNRFDRICNDLPLSIDFNEISNGELIRIYHPIVHRFAHSIFDLRLSNKDTDGKISFFLEYFQLDDFPNLRVLGLYKLLDIDIKKIAQNLSNLKYLEKIFIEDAYILHEKNLKALHAAIFHQEECTLQKLILHSNYNFSMAYVKVSNIQHLSLNRRIDVFDLFQLFRLMPEIKILLLKNFVWLDNDQEFILNINKHAFQIPNLKRLEIPFNRYNDIQECRFKQIEILLSYFPYLQSLLMIRTTTAETDHDYGGISCMDAQSLQHLIESLPHLKTFEFFIKLSSSDYGHYYSSTIDTMIAPFCTDFWLDHNICVVIDCFEDSQLQIYTLPYSGFSLQDDRMSLYDVETTTNNYAKMTKNLYVNLDELHVEQLKFRSSEVKLQIHRYAKIRNLNLCLGDIYNDDQQKFIEDLREMIVLSRVKRLKLVLDSWEHSDRCGELPHKILECTSNVDTLYLTWFRNTYDLYKDEKLCACLNKTIKNIHFTIGFELSVDGLDRFLSIFRYIETLYIELKRKNLKKILPKLLNELEYLTFLRFPVYTTDTRASDRVTLNKTLVLNCISQGEIKKRCTFEGSNGFYYIWLHEKNREF